MSFVVLMSQTELHLACSHQAKLPILIFFFKSLKWTKFSWIAWVKRKIRLALARSSVFGMAVCSQLCESLRNKIFLHSFKFLFCFICLWIRRCPESVRPEAVRPCLLPCRKDCVVTLFSEWTPCPTACQPGKPLRSRNLREKLEHWPRNVWQMKFTPV